MELPKIQGLFNRTDFFIYVACDASYFDEFAVSLVNSIEKNSKQGIHIHIFNPRNDQLEKFYRNANISVTYERVDPKDFETAAKNLESCSYNDNTKFKYERSINAMQKGQDANLLERVMKTYYACARFIRLNQLVMAPQNCFAIDIDAIVRKNIPVPEKDFDFYIHHISGKKSRFLAGGMFFLENNQSKKYLAEYSQCLEENIKNDNIYWSLDQEVLDSIVPKYNYGQLPLAYIDWDMKKDSYIWTAKGERKSSPVFVNEKSRYNS